MTGLPKKKIVLWCITDNKPGHKNQLRGLAAALEERIDIEVCFVEVPVPKSVFQKLISFLRYAFGRINFDSNLPRPDWVAACGHSTHFPLMAAAKKFKAKSILLMKPTLNSSWFDLCFVPEHDEPQQANNIVPTRGVLNVIRPSEPLSEEHRISLVLIGGPSSHHDWDDETIIHQVETIQEKLPTRKIVLTTSRRTPEETTKKILVLENDFLKVVPVEQTDSHWVPEHLGKANQVFVTEDSVSMIYEAITSGAAVTILDVPRKNKDSLGRVIKGVERLIEDQFVLEFTQWATGKKLPESKQALNEADRCAEIVVNRFLNEMQR